MLTQLLTMLVLVPILGFVGCMLTPRKKERAIFSIAIAAILLEFIVFLLLGYQWLHAGALPVFTSVGSLYASHSYTFDLSFYFDKIGAVFLGMAIIMTTLIFVFSKYYLHREQGFKRFYCTVLLFFIGLTLIILAGNFEVLFLGWEFIGISSVLLIAFYRDRFLPARNALKVFSVYRIGDAFLLAAIWYAHHIFEKSVNFSEFSGLVAQHGNSLVILGLLLLVVAMIKSAQFPFSYWLPRAMEGPTTSSAIFYGALSVHMGLFLLLRTYPLWEGSMGLRITIAVLGLVTAVVASSIARAQSSIKTQIAYASITQIGIMFIEVAAGLQWLALLHFVSNASLRTYQLLISPSVVSYLVHDQFFYFVPPVQRIKNTFLGKIHATFYILGIKEWSMNTAVSYYLWKPLKSIGRVFAFLDSLFVQITVFVLFLAALIVVASIALSADLLLVASTIAAVISIIFYIRAYTTKNSARIAWNLIMLGHLFGVLFLVLASTRDWKYLAMYGAGVIAAFIVGHICLWYLETKDEPNALRDYHGSIYAFPRLGNLFFIVSLLFMAFPISPSFLAQDMLISLIPEGHAFQVVLFCLSYLLVGVSTIRLYTKVFFGSHKTSYHETAYKSS
ncbi:MAG TPA: proton-conducting transporter membrane subunit [Candidatus Chromulinivoraceae bacterium]|nr:proton-conducting transporter membrane subunit [Candidatus Chromulinivoraceae bacterium]